ncbi:hypothetical protein Hanom_Chr17g01572771 [Helianthus anomalus]
MFLSIHVNFSTSLVFSIGFTTTPSFYKFLGRNCSGGCHGRFRVRESCGGMAEIGAC